MARASCGSAPPTPARRAGAEADASVTTEPGIACTVLVADCLPVLFAAPDGRARRRGARRLARPGGRRARGHGRCAVRGRGAARRANSSPGWAPASGRARSRSAPTCSTPSARRRRGAPLRARAAADGGKWLADLPALARDRLRRRGRARRQRRRLVHRRGRVTVLFVPARRRHRPHGRRRLDRRRLRRLQAALGAGGARRRRAGVPIVEHDGQRQHAVQHER